AHHTRRPARSDRCAAARNLQPVQLDVTDVKLGREERDMRRTIMTAALTTAAWSAPMMAQEQVEAPRAASTGVEEIIVTAQKREQNLQDVPIAISALSPAFLEKREVTSIASLSGLAPNLKVDTAGANHTSSIIAIRGGVQGNPQIYFEPSVGV